MRKIKLAEVERLRVPTDAESGGSFAGLARIGIGV
jgi:hypothetical protein